MSFDLVSLGKILAAVGAAITGLGIALPVDNEFREIIIATGVFVTAISAFIANYAIKKNGVK